MKIFRYLKPYWFLVLMAPLTMIGEVLMDLFQPTLMSTIVDVGLGEGMNDLEKFDIEKYIYGLFKDL